MKKKTAGIILFTCMFLAGCGNFTVNRPARVTATPTPQVSVQEPETVPVTTPTEEIKATDTPTATPTVTPTKGVQYAKGADPDRLKGYMSFLKGFNMKGYVNPEVVTEALKEADDLLLKEGATQKEFDDMIEKLKAAKAKLNDGKTAVERNDGSYDTPEVFSDDPLAGKTAVKWVGTWASAQLTPGNDTMPPAPGLSGNTYRQIVRVSIPGNKIRITFSNIFGESDLEIKEVHAAKALSASSSKIDVSTDVVLTFNGSKSVTVPKGKTVTCDAFDFKLETLGFLSVTAEFGNVPKTITSHTASRSHNYLLSGSHLKDEEFSGASKATSWYFLSDIDVFVPEEYKAVVCFGDSITDGYGVQPNTYARWSDALAEKLQTDKATRNIGVLNSGIGGNSIYGGNGQAAKDRFKRDVLEHDGVEYVIILIGVNDIGYAWSTNTATSVTDGLSNMIKAAHAKGIKVYGGTITPFKGNGYYSEMHESIRQTVNKWIRSENSGFDAVIDFDAILRDENDPETMAKDYKNDGLHPSPKGYVFMGKSIDLNLFK